MVTTLWCGFLLAAHTTLISKLVLWFFLFGSGSNHFVVFRLVLGFRVVVLETIRGLVASFVGCVLVGGS